MQPTPQKTTQRQYVGPHRGDPKPGSLVHLHMPGQGVHSDYPACRNGNFHIRWNADPSAVTCPACLEKINPAATPCNPSK